MNCGVSRCCLVEGFPASESPKEWNTVSVMCVRMVEEVACHKVEGVPFLSQNVEAVLAISVTPSKHNPRISPAHTDLIRVP